MNFAESCPTARLEKLLLATDGSDFSEGAVRESINFAKRCSSTIIAVSVVQTNPEFEAMAPNLAEKEDENARRAIEALKARAAEEGVTCETVVRHGEDPYRHIIEEAQKFKADMIMMGRRGRTGLKKFMMGSQTAHVIGHSPCNVLVVPKDAKLELGNILVATDGSKYSQAAVREAIGIAKRCGSKLGIVSVVPSELLWGSGPDTGYTQKQLGLIAKELSANAEKSAAEVQALALNEGVRADKLVVTGSPYEAVLDIAGQRNANLIVVGSHGRTGLKKILMGSVAERIVGLSTCAVLVVKLK